MWLNRGRFRDNGNCGYLLRPPFHQPGFENKLQKRRRAAEESAEFSLLSKREVKRLEKEEARHARKQARLDAIAAKKQAKGDARAAKEAKKQAKRDARQAIINEREAKEEAAAKARAEAEALQGPRRVAQNTGPTESPLTPEEEALQAEIDAIEKVEAETAAATAEEEAKAAAAAAAAAEKEAADEDESASEDEDDEEEEEEDSDGDPNDDVTDEEGEDAKRWHPPQSFEAYVAESKWATEAATYTVRVLSVSHLPKKSSGAAASSSSGNGGSSGATSSIFSAAPVEDDSGLASLEVELHGAPCDSHKWPPSDEVSNDGVKHVFDEAVSVDIAEPRLALMRFTVMRQGVPCAQTVVPCHLMRPGVRWVQLYDPLSYSDKVTADYLLTRLLVLVHKEPCVREVDGDKSAPGRFGQKFANLGAKAKQVALKLKKRDASQAREPSSER